VPKLSSLQLLERIEELLRDLEAGKELEASEVNVLLTPRKLHKAKWDYR
jgi:hypothetical protein